MTTMPVTFHHWKQINQIETKKVTCPECEGRKEIFITCLECGHDYWAKCHEYEGTGIIIYDGYEEYEKQRSKDLDRLANWNSLSK